MKGGLPNQGQTNLPSLYSEQFPEGSQKEPRSYSYHKAIKELRDLDRRIWTMRNRLNLLQVKQQHANNHSSSFFEEREYRLKTINREYKEKTLMELQTIKEKSQSQITLQKAKNEARKLENERCINRARRIVTEEKVKRHDLICQATYLNKKTIQTLRVRSLAQKKQKHNEILERSRKSKVNLMETQQSRMATIRAECREETNKLIEKILARRRELKEMQIECESQEQSLRVLLSRRQRKLKRIQGHRKPVTTETNSSVMLQGSTTPGSRVSFVIIT